MNTQSNNDYWKKKLDALFHDSPDKPLDIKDHWARAQSLSLKYCYDHEADQNAQYFDKSSDYQSAAADRLPFPKYMSKKHTGSIFNGTTHPFKHPLGGCEYNFKEAGTDAFKTADQALDVSFGSRPDLIEGDDRAAFLSFWRFWQNWAADADKRFNFLPAETRLPDHTIWNHLSFTTAMQGCIDQGGGLELMVFTIGPVQDFIAAARSTRDLWSGSYLLSYLIATAMRDVALKYGPDHIISPNLLGQPIIDLLLCDDIWKDANTNDQKSIADSLRDGLFEDSARLLTPSLPNRFLAILPRVKAAEFAKQLESNLHKTFKAIADSVKEGVLAESTANALEFDGIRFDQQVSQSLEVYWQCLPVPNTYKDAKTLIEKLPERNKSIDALEKIIDATPENDRDKRNFLDQDTASGIPSQPTAAWAGLYALTDWLLAGTKNTRCFDAWGGTSSWNYGKENNKDILNGKEESVIKPPSEDLDIQQVTKAIKKGEFMGATTLIKRLWHQSYLLEKYKDKGIVSKDFGMPNTHSIAKGFPFKPNSENDPEDGYYAIIALDGDEMGKWLSGAKAPKLKSVLSKEMIDYFPDELVKNTDRPLNPSFHLQFSEILGNFALLMVRMIVQAHKGRLIYAGGDDVLAMLPAKEALDCSKDLRAAFQGDKKALNEIKGFWWHDKLKRKDPYFEKGHRLFNCMQEGFIRLHKDIHPAFNDNFLSYPFNYDVMVPGPNADVSVGIAIGHCKSPLQDLVKEAQKAEKRAKGGVLKKGKQKPDPDKENLEAYYDIIPRSAYAVSIFKRSGEITNWQSQWDANELGLYQSLLDAIEQGNLSNRFPYRLEEFITPYIPSNGMKTDPEFAKNCYEIIEHEFKNCLKQHDQGGTDKQGLSDAFHDAYIGKSSDYMLHQLPGLLRTVAWSSKH